MSGAGYGVHETTVLLQGRTFYKLTGSGNDFVFFDDRDGAGITPLRSAAAIAAVCDRRNGIGADGVVFVEGADEASVRIAYYNRDGSRAALCGNATLCTARLAAELGLFTDVEAPFVVMTDAGRIEARIGPVGDPTIALGPVRDAAEAARGVHVQAGERAIGYALVGVPHLVVLVDDIDAIALDARGAALRAPTPERPDGANVNWVSRAGEHWRMRTFERGVEGETLACGTGAVAAGTLIARWTGLEGPITLLTSSGRPVVVTPPTREQPAGLLAGEGRLVFAGQVGTLPILGD